MAAPAPDALRRPYVLVRHGETTYNVSERLNGDPAIPVPLSDAGVDQCRALAPLIAQIPWASVWITRFSRTRQSAGLLVPTWQGPLRVAGELDDICLGEFESRPRSDYRAWRGHHGVAEAPSGGESRAAVMARYARGLWRIVAQAPTPALVVTHDQPIRYTENVLAGEDPVFGRVSPVPNAVPYGYDAWQLRCAADRLALRAQAPQASDEARPVATAAVSSSAPR